MSGAFDVVGDVVNTAFDTFKWGVNKIIPGKGPFNRGGGKKQLPAPGPSHTPSHAAGGGGGFSFEFPELEFPEFPEIPEPEIPEVQPLPDDAAILAAKRRKLAGRRGGRTSTILSDDPSSRLV